jgi:TusA-related sulfurtransferase
MTLENAPALVAKYRDWFGTCTDFQLVASRVGWVGERLGIFYSFLLQDGGDWYRIEQQVYCTLRDARVVKLHLLCSGFQLVGASEQSTSPAAPVTRAQDPVRDAVLEFRSEQPGSGGTCAVLTPMIRSKLREMESGQVLEVRVDDPSARGDVEAWSRLSGNTLLQVIADEGPMLRFFVKKK